MKYFIRANVILLFSLITFTACSSLPQGQPGPAADELARKLLNAYGHEKWLQLPVVQFVFRQQNRYTWHKLEKRVIIEMDYDDAEDIIMVDFNLAKFQGKVLYPTHIEPAEGNKLIKKSIERFVNDSFWLNPFRTLFDPGASREKVADNQLLLKFSSGGVTPGDAYLFLLGPDYLPREMKMWVKVLPIKGATADFQNWQNHEGVNFSTLHKIGMFTVTVDEIKTGKNFRLISKENLTPQIYLD